MTDFNQNADFELEDSGQDQGNMQNGFGPTYQSGFGPDYMNNQNNGNQGFGYNQNNEGVGQNAELNSNDQNSGFGYTPNNGGYNPNNGGYNHNNGGYNPNNGGQPDFSGNMGGTYQAQPSRVKEFNSPQHNKFANKTYKDCLMMLKDNILGIFNGNINVKDLIFNFNFENISNTFNNLNGDVNVSAITSAGFASIAVAMITCIFAQASEIIISILIYYGIGTIVKDIVKAILTMAVVIALGGLGNLVLCKYKNCWNSVVVKVLIVLSLLSAAANVLAIVRLVLNVGSYIVYIGIIPFILRALVDVLYVGNSIVCLNALSRGKNLQ